MPEKVLKSIKESGLIGRGERVLAAFSGGADSTALLLALQLLQKELDFTLFAAHFNHGIRGEDSDEDESFCRSLCEKLGVPFYCEKKNVPEYARKNGLSTETAARLLRYDFLYRVSKKTLACKTVTAHHMQDNAESILMHIIRGSGTAGLCGMKKEYLPELPKIYDGEGGAGVKGGENREGAKKNEKRTLRIIRPLLELEKRDILAFLEEHEQTYRTDKTNFEADTARNFLRLLVMPQIESGINKNAAANICRLGNIASEDEEFLSSLAKKALDEARDHGGYLTEKLINLPIPVKKRAIRLILSENGALINAEQAHIEGICGLIGMRSGASIDLPSARARLNFGRLLIEKTEKTESGEKIYKNAKNGANFGECGENAADSIKNRSISPQNAAKNAENAVKGAENAVFLLEMREGIQNTPLGSFRLTPEAPFPMEKQEQKEYNRAICADRNTALLDMDKLCGALYVRTRRAGDRFHPLNSEWRMKLKDYFISRKVDKTARDRIPLLCCCDEIIFIPGLVIADGVKADASTKRMLRVEYLGADGE